MKPAFTGNENFFSLLVISFLSMQLGMNASQTDWDLFLLQFKLYDVEAILPYFLYSFHVFNTVHTKPSYRKSTCPIFTTCHYFQIFYNIQFFRSSIITFHFFDELPSLLVNSLLWLSSFVKCHMNLSLENKEVTHLYTLLSVQKINNRCTVTNLQQTLREVMWLVTNYDGHLSIDICSDL